jgi:hypothetical protein
MEIEEVKDLLKHFKKEDILFGKLEDYILDRINTSKEEVIEELLLGENLEFVEEQTRDNETRHALFFIYSKRKGRVYVVKLTEKLRIITAWPLGKKTLSKYHKKRFISSGDL